MENKTKDRVTVLVGASMTGELRELKNYEEFL
jgi:hypothetical protein